MELIKMAIFDLGNVVYGLSFDNAFALWSKKSGRPFEELKSKFVVDSMYALHETNKVSIGQYKEHVCDMLGIDLSLSDFITGWNSVFMDELEGIADVLEELRRSMTVVALSNTNEIHYSFMQRRYWKLFRSFHRMYFSHEMQFRKPDAESFAKILSDFQLSAEETIFFDDAEENVRGARDVGIKSMHVRSVADIQAAVSKYCNRRIAAEAVL